MLTVYRASAGSGKTHRLTGEYLKWLFSQQGAYKRILAVTFTNKATDEMKGRIIKELYRLASGHRSDYMEELASLYSFSEKQVRAGARKILITILHDYSAFNISTIDRFFQQTMRAFTREIGLQGGYGIEMDQELVLAEVIDRLMDDLEKPENKELLGWLLRFAEEKIENGGEWNLRREMKALSREVFKESYKTFSDRETEDIRDKQLLERYKDTLYAVIRSVESEAKRLGEEGTSLMRQYGLQPSDFKGVSRSPLYFFEKLRSGEMKEPSATFTGLVDTVENWYTRTTPPAIVQIIGCAFEEGLNECVRRVVTLFANMAGYYTAKEIVRHYYTLGILGDVSRQIAAYREEKNILLITDTAELLHKVIDESETPFIYEKTGTRIDHYMIDEFQDTSRMQWHNFYPLIRESLAHRQYNMVVGDVKQSIYRFRNSDWKLLDEQVKNDFLPGQVEEETLKENWRSCRHIVSFNNALFTIAPALLQSLYNESLEASSLTESEQAPFLSRIMSAYEGSFQLTPPPLRGKEGHVRIEFLPDEEEAGWKEASLLRLPSVLEELQDKGYALKEMAILVRTNHEGAMIADTLLAYKEEHPSTAYRYDMISDDALFISSSPGVRFLIALLRYLKNPDDMTRKQMALIACAAMKGHLSPEEWGEDFPPGVRRSLDALSRRSLYEIAEGLFRLFTDLFPENEQVFIQAFFDMVSEFARKESADLSRFLKWWDETGGRKTIATPEEQDAIRILTIHKSKGLGFKAVILPFGNWEIDHRAGQSVILWCRPEKEPFNRLSLVPVRYGQILTKTIFAKDYFHERLHTSIDNLNTLYVAFTRAEEELIVFSPRPSKVDEESGEIGRISSIADLLWAGLCTPEEHTRSGEPLIPLSASFDRTEGSFELGGEWRPAASSVDERGAEEIPMRRLSSALPDERLRLRLHGKGFFFDRPQRKHGALMHEVLSRIGTKQDIPAAVESYRLEGIIDREEERMLALRLQELLASPDVAPWFDHPARVLNEVSILAGDGITRRPDRVMIEDDRVVVVDYKFGLQDEKRHHRQVRNYLSLIRRMGYGRVEGYLWYVELNKIEPVIG
ncbi:MAG: UvrD-helicase domain-containing protein [Tannerellaceae bacterium]|jgi:ATP-dependent exoDNAse (exonuclease V) beta subunit|nr:UvrD-helicase domain-containing protein [Tannerellaceae bacterium]